MPADQARRVALTRTAEAIKQRLMEDAKLVKKLKNRPPEYGEIPLTEVEKQLMRDTLDVYIETLESEA